MGKKLAKRKRAAVLPQLQTPPVITADAENKPEPRATMVVKPVWPLQNVHPFEVLLMGARNAGMANGLWEGMQMQEELEAQLLELWEYIERLEQWESGKDRADTAKVELLP
jgi:hypothetical protein